MNGKKSVVGVVLILAVLVGLLLVQSVAAQDLPDCYVRIVKEVDPPDSEQVFRFNWAWLASFESEQIFDLGHGEDYVFDTANVGGLSITEQIPVGWEQPEIECEYDPKYTSVSYYATEIEILTPECDQVECKFKNTMAPPPPPPPPTEAPFVPEASTLVLLGSAASGLAGYVGLQWRARRRK
jgi:hypothetical protein